MNPFFLERSRTNAFVGFARLRDAERAVDELDGMDLGSGPIRILWKDTSFPNGKLRQCATYEAAILDPPRIPSRAERPFSNRANADPI